MRCECCHRRFGVKLSFYGSTMYCQSCLTLKVQEDLDYMVENGFAAKTEEGYELTDKGRLWPHSSESVGAESTTVQEATASESTTQEPTE